MKLVCDVFGIVVSAESMCLLSPACLLSPC